MKYKLGRKPYVHDPKFLQFAKYAVSLPPLPPRADWFPMVQAPFGMDGNDTVGDCTCAAIDHMLMVWTAAAGDIVVPTTSDALGLYSAITGYDPADPNTDQGAVVSDVLKYCKQYGIVAPGGPHKIGAFVQVDPKNHDHIKQAIALFGGVYFGVSLPSEWENAPIWDVSNSQIAGGHAIPGFSYNTEYVQGVTIVTWGETRLLTWPAIDQYCDEAWAVISPDFVSGKLTAPSGFDLKTLQADLAAL